MMDSYVDQEYLEEVGYRIELQMAIHQEICDFCGRERPGKKCAPGPCLIYLVTHEAS